MNNSKKYTPDNTPSLNAPTLGSNWEPLINGIVLGCELLTPGMPLSPATNASGADSPANVLFLQHRRSKMEKTAQTQSLSQLTIGNM